MKKYTPRIVTQVTDHLEKLPGIGPKTAQRLTYYLLHMPKEQVQGMAEAIGSLHEKTKRCSVCMNIDEQDPCGICEQRDRNRSVICVVEQPLDVGAIERSGVYEGLYHVLHGVISPLDHIGPDELFIDQLWNRLDSNVEELILGLNPSMEGEATSLYLKQEINRRGLQVKVSRLAQGLPLGGDVEYADAVTLGKALEGRREF